jgi:hypothetical protein
MKASKMATTSNEEDFYRKFDEICNRNRVTKETMEELLAIISVYSDSCYREGLEQ